MIPLRDHTPSGIFPIITTVLITINVMVFLAYFPGSTDAFLWQFFQLYAFIPADFSQGENLITLITSMFLHGSWMHLAGNMLFLYIFGDNIEARLGKFWYAIFYICGGFAATMLQYIGDVTSVIPNVGASGAIAAVMGAYLVWYPQGKIDMLMLFGGMSRITTIPAYTMLLYWFGLQMISSFTGMDDGVAYLAHIGGFAFGALFAVFFRNKNTYQNSGNMIG